MAANPKYHKGDLVKACYTFFDYYAFDFDEDEDFYKKDENNPMETEILE